MDPTWLGAGAAVAAIIVAAYKPLQLAWRLLRETHEFLGEWRGTLAHNGLDATPGVVARLAALEKLGEKLVDETQPNGGNSLRDVVHRTAQDVADIKDEQARLRAQIEQRLRGQIEQIERRHPPEGTS